MTPEGVIGQHVSPDGRSLLAQGSDGLWQVVALETGKAVAARGLRRGDIVAGWSSDGGAAFVTTEWWKVPSRLERVNLTSGTRTLDPEWRAVDHAGLTTAIAVVVRNDGRRYSYSYQRLLSTLYQIDGLNLSVR